MPVPMGSASICSVTTANCKKWGKWQTAATLRLKRPVLNLQKLVWSCHYKCINMERWRGLELSANCIIDFDDIQVWLRLFSLNLNACKDLMVFFKNWIKIWPEDIKKGLCCTGLRDFWVVQNRDCRLQLVASFNFQVYYDLDHSSPTAFSERVAFNLMQHVHHTIP